MHPAGVLGRARRTSPRPLRRSPPVPAGHREVRAGRHALRHRWRQPHDPGRTRARPTARCCAVPTSCVPGDVLAAPPVAVVPVLRPVHRSDQPVTAHRRGPQRLARRARDRLRRARTRLDASRALPWLVDRFFRNLLTDLTGNTHRAEFCIDKLFSPESERGRLGLLELRALRDAAPSPDGDGAVPPRAVARGAVLGGSRGGPAGAMGHRAPRPVPAAPRGRRRHRVGGRGPARPRHRLRPVVDRSVPRVPLPANRHRLGSRGSRSSCAPPSNRGWCSARSPRSMGTARYVDSSVERLQVRTDGLAPERHVADLQRRARAPAAAPASPGVRVAGVRYRAWQPPTALHPTIAGAIAARLRRRRPRQRPVGRRLHVPRDPSGRAVATTTSPSTPTRPTPAGGTGSPSPTTRRARSTWPRCVDTAP